MAALTTEADEFRHLVVGLARRVITRAPDQLQRARLAHDIQAGVATRDNGYDRGERHLPALEHQRFDVTGKVVYGNERHAARPRERLRERHTNEQGTDEPWPLRDGDRVVASVAAIEQRALDDAADVADVLSR